MDWVLITIAAIGFGITLGVVVWSIITREMRRLLQGDIESGFTGGEKRKNDQLSEGESRKLKNEDPPWAEDEKPKRQTSHFELGDDGELFEVFDKN